MIMQPLITLHKITKKFKPEGCVHEALQDIDLEIYPNEIVALIGPSGCGKTTILKIVADIVEPSSGQVRYREKHIDTARKAGLLGYVPQHASLLPNLTVAENVALSLKIRGTYDPQRIATDIHAVGMDGYEQYYPHQLSGGMKQRVSIARALVHEPEVILMDEPFSSIDEIMREQLDCKLLSVFQRLKPTILFVTHSIEEAVFLSSRVVIMSKSPGKIMDTVKINLPEQRTIDVKNTQEFFKEVVNIREKIRMYA